MLSSYHSIVCLTGHKLICFSQFPFTGVHWFPRPSCTIVPQLGPQPQHQHDQSHKQPQPVFGNQTHLAPSMTRKDCFCLHDYRRVLSLINHFRIKVHSPSVYYAGTTGDFLSNFSSYSFHLAHGIGHLDWTRNSAMNRCTTTGTRVRVVKTFSKMLAACG